MGINSECLCKNLTNINLLHLKDIKSSKIDLIVADEDLLDYILKNFYKQHFIIITNKRNWENALFAYRNGAYAYLENNISQNTFEVILKQTLKGVAWIEPKIAPIALASLPNMQEKQIYLTKREKEVLELVVKGKNNTEIAKDLVISVHTAKAHVCEIPDKFKVRDRVQATVKAVVERYVIL